MTHASVQGSAQQWPQGARTCTRWKVCCVQSMSFILAVCLLQNLQIKEQSGPAQEPVFKESQVNSSGYMDQKRANCHCQWVD
eukprot:1160616-Pelagomonas_calceolata.AAC.3